MHEVTTTNVSFPSTTSQEVLDDCYTTDHLVPFHSDRRSAVMERDHLVYAAKEEHRRQVECQRQTTNSGRETRAAPKFAPPRPILLWPRLSSCREAVKHRSPGQDNACLTSAAATLGSQDPKTSHRSAERESLFFRPLRALFVIFKDVVTFFRP
jgi:hypothetical protein